jgi:hypothetical protein
LTAEVFHLLDPQPCWLLQGFFSKFARLVLRHIASNPKRNSTEWRHTAHEQAEEVRITYRFHPRFGELVQIRRRLKRGGCEFIVLVQPDGSFASFPASRTAVPIT